MYTYNICVLFGQVFDQVSNYPVDHILVINRTSLVNLIMSSNLLSFYYIITYLIYIQ